MLFSFCYRVILECRKYVCIHITCLPFIDMQQYNLPRELPVIKLNNVCHYMDKLSTSCDSMLGYILRMAEVEWLY